MFKFMVLTSAQFCDIHLKVDGTTVAEIHVRRSNLTENQRTIQLWDSCFFFFNKLVSLIIIQGSHNNYHNLSEGELPVTYKTPNRFHLSILPHWIPGSKYMNSYGTNLWHIQTIALVNSNITISPTPHLKCRKIQQRRCNFMGRP